MKEGYIIKPFSIIRDKNLTPTEADFLCLISGLANSTGCTASNNYFAKVFGVSRQRVVEVISNLKRKKFIRTKEIKAGRKTVRRIIEITDDNRKKILPTGRKNFREQLERKPDKVRKKSHTHILKGYIKDNNKEEEPLSFCSSFRDYWNSKSNLPKIKILTEQRKRKIEIRMKERLFAENWKVIIDKLSVSKFCTGNNERGWRADADWVIKDGTNYVKVLEGKYDNAKSSAEAAVQRARRLDRMREGEQDNR